MSTETVIPTRDRAEEALSHVLSMFQSGLLPAAIAQTRIIREANDRPLSAWSLSNQLLAFAASTDDARGFRQWKQAGRTVRKGSKAFYILAPRTIKKSETDESGETSDHIVVIGFLGIPVFRIEDTDGEPIEYPDYTPSDPPPLLEVAERLGVPVRYLPSSGGGRGTYDMTRGEITLGTHDVDTFFHELGHAAHTKVEQLKGGQDPRQEIVAELVAATLCHVYGFDGFLAEAYDYVAYYDRQKDPAKAAVRVLSTVGKVLDVILSSPRTP